MVVSILKNSTKKMKIFQVKYNHDKYCYYKAEEKKLFNIDSDLYNSYPDCKEDINKISGYEFHKIKESLLNYFKKQENE